jgi:hypothetical protein
MSGPGVAVRTKAADANRMRVDESGTVFSYKWMPEFRSAIAGHEKQAFGPTSFRRDWHRRYPDKAWLQMLGFNGAKPSSQH